MGTLAQDDAPKIIVLVLLCLFLILSGCVKSATKSARNSLVTTSGPAANDSIQVMMLGRSVMGGWFTHWTGDTSRPYNKDGFSLYYREIDGPDTIMDSVQLRVDEDAGKADIVFFKLCFVDFNGDDRDSAESNLKRNEAYVQKAYDIVVTGAGKKLVVGNTLPQVKSATTDDLFWNHREYNKWLNDFAAAHPGQVWIFDEYGILSDAEGNLRNDYATSADDSHPNDAGYTALDGPLFNLLKKINN